LLFVESMESFSSLLPYYSLPSNLLPAFFLSQDKLLNITASTMWMAHVNGGRPHNKKQCCRKYCMIYRILMLLSIII
jgi:hypothetical protein